MVRQKDHLIHGQFKLHSNADDTTGNKLVNYPPLIPFNCKGQAECKHCGHVLSDSNTTRKKQHLIQSCPKFLDHCRSKGISNFLTKLASECEDGQQKLNFPSIPPQAKKDLDLAFAKVCYIHALPFNLYESEAMQNALHKVNPAYKPPTRRSVAGALLDSTYESLKVEVEATIAIFDWINCISDESTNINTARIFNTCLHTPHDALHWSSDDIDATQLTAENAATMIRKNMHAISKGQPERINNLSTDTCDTMLSIHRRLAQYPELKHIFFIPCDSHGLQLLVKNILGLPSFKAILEKGQKIVKAFKKSPLQLARLRVLQQEIYGQHRSLCLSVITRWGIQYRLIESVLNSKDALRRYATIFRGEKLNKTISQACQFIDDLDLTF